MTKRRAASVLVFGRNHGFRGHVPPIVAALSGTGVIAAAGIMTVVMNTAGTWNLNQVYLTVSSGTNIGTLIGTGPANPFPI